MSTNRGLMNIETAEINVRKLVDDARKRGAEEFYMPHMDAALAAADACSDADMRAAHLLDAANNAEVVIFSAEKTAARDNEYYARGPVPHKPWHDRCRRLDADSVACLLDARAAWMGRILPGAKGEGDYGAYQLANHYAYGSAATELHEWLAQTWQTVEVFGAPKWVQIDIEKYHLPTAALRRKIISLREELATAAERELAPESAEKKAEATVFATFFGEPRTMAQIAAELRTTREAFESMPHWARFAPAKK